MIKVKKVETYNSQLVCKGKLVLIEHNALASKIHVTIKGRIYIPIIVSENECPDVGDKIIGYNGSIFNYVKGETYIDGRKILAISENFSPEQLQIIVDGKLKDGDEVLIECEHHDDTYDIWNIINITNNNHINIFHIKKDESWDEIYNEYGRAETTKKFNRWLENNYHPPKKK